MDGQAPDSQAVWTSLQPRDVRGTRFRLASLESVDSTNTQLARWCREGLPPWLALRSDHQTRGRGRRDRPWEAPPQSGMLMSILFPASDPDRLGDAGRAVGLAAVAAVRSLGPDVWLKWPNDLVTVGDDGHLEKLAGVLGEVVSSGASLLGVVVGIGLNLRPVPEREATLGRLVVTLDELCDHRPSPDEMAELLLEHLENVVSRAETEGSEYLRAETDAVSATLGRELVVQTDTTTHVGRCLGTDAAGRLMLETPDGPMALDVGDVVSARL